MGEKVWTPLEVIEYPEDLKMSMEYLF